MWQEQETSSGTLWTLHCTIAVSTAEVFEHARSVRGSSSSVRCIAKGASKTLKKWQHAIMYDSILVMTPQQLVDVLKPGHASLQQIQLLVSTAMPCLRRLSWAYTASDLSPPFIDPWEPPNSRCQSLIPHKHPRLPKSASDYRSFLSMRT